MVNISKVDFRYATGTFRMRIPELEVGAGVKAAIIGPSGSGKTTFLNLVSGILVPTSGSVRIDGCDLSTEPDAARRSFRIANIGFVFQDFELLEYLNVLDNIVHPYRLNPALLLTNEIRTRAGKLADETGVGDKLRRFPEQLSQGERQWAAICRALLPQPKLLLADEPTGNLDPASKGHILELLFDYVDNNQATLITVTHDHSLLDGFDRVIDFKDFEVVYQHEE